MKPRCGIDLDGVVYHWMDQCSIILDAWYGVPREQWDHYDAGKEQALAHLGPALGAEAWRSLFTKFGQERGLWSDGAAYPGAVEGMARLACSHDVVVVTKRPSIAAKDTYEWLHRHGLYPSGLVMLDPAGGREKDTVPCDWYVDDSPAVVEGLAAKGFKVYLMDRPWNQACQAGLRVRDWADLLAHVFNPMLEAR